MELFSCPKCDYTTTKSINSLRIHYSKSKHGPSEELWQLLFNNGKPVTCKCGCGETVKFLGIVKGYADWKRGHISRVKNNWGHNDDVLKKSQAVRRQMFKDGELKVWNKGLTVETDDRVADYTRKMNTPERAAKISAALIGIPKSDEHREKIQAHMQEYWSHEEHRAVQSIKRADHIRNNGVTYQTTYHGWYNGLKKCVASKVYYRSLFEYNALIYLEGNDEIQDYAYEPCRIPYTIDGKTRQYVPDFLIRKVTGERLLVEIKPHCHIKNEKNRAKESAARKYAAEYGYGFEYWTERTHPNLSDVPEM